MTNPCTACGFEVFEEPVGGYEICPICGWEDDPVQYLYAALIGGANGKCLFEWQQRVLEELPIEIQQRRGFSRDPRWRPLTAEEAQDAGNVPRTGTDYFQAVPMDVPEYYWRKS